MDPTKNEGGLFFKDSSERQSYCRELVTLSTVPTPSATREIVRALKNKSGRVRKYAAQALGRKNSADALEALLKSINDQDELVRWTVLRSLSKFSDERVEQLAERYLKDHSPRSWTAAAVLFSSEKISPSRESLKEGLTSSEAFVRALALRLLGKYSSFHSETLNSYTIFPFLQDVHPAVREEATQLSIAHAGGEERLRQRQMRFKENNDKVKGSLYAVLIGDALGAPVESLSLKEIKEKYGRVKTYLPQTARRGTIRPEGSCTDDGDLTLTILSSLVKRKNVDYFDIAQKFGEIALQIDEDFEKNIGYGYGALMAMRKLYAGVNWRFSGNDSDGCGAAMRVAPFAALAISEEELIFALSEQARITHQNNLAIAGAVVIGCAIHKAYTLEGGFDKHKYIDSLAKKVCSLSPELADEIKFLHRVIHQNPEEVYLQIPVARKNPFRKGKGALGTVPLALYSFLHSPDDFVQTAITAVNHSGDSDSVAAMACAISGAYNGCSAIPSDYINGLQEGRLMEKLVQQIF